MPGPSISNNYWWSCFCRKVRNNLARLWRLPSSWVEELSNKTRRRPKINLELILCLVCSEIFVLFPSLLSLVQRKLTTATATMLKLAALVSSRAQPFITDNQASWKDISQCPPQQKQWAQGTQIGTMSKWWQHLSPRLLSQDLKSQIFYHSGGRKFKQGLWTLISGQATGKQRTTSDCKSNGLELLWTKTLERKARHPQLQLHRSELRKTLSEKWHYCNTFNCNCNPTGYKRPLKAAFMRSKFYLF